MEYITAIPVILTGVLEKNPEPFLSPDRRLGCTLQIRTKNLFFVNSTCTTAVHSSYTVHIFEPMRDILFACADVHCPVTIPGFLSRTTHILSAEYIFNAEE